MSLVYDINEILKDLRAKGIVDAIDESIGRMSGTTDGHLYTLSVGNEIKYVLKLDTPHQISLIEQWHQAYTNSTLPPKLLYTDPAKTFIVYTYIAGTTHYHRGSKINWLSLLVNRLINYYENYPHTDKWGFWLEDPCESWRDFIDQGVEGARVNIGSLLPTEDYDNVKALVGNISVSEDHERFLLHGDCGVHNFVFNQLTLTGVIDPSPIVGPARYDFMYAFCSSPDELNLETLISAFALLNHESMDRSRLIEEVIIQLYCRIGVCLKHHPYDLADYLKAWEYWKVLK